MKRRMKNPFPLRLALRLAFGAVLCVTLGAALRPLETKGEEYTYTVRFFAGRQGVLHNNDSTAGVDPDGDGRALVFEGLHYGDRISFNQNMVTLNDGSKYYVKGIRESGRDNSTVTMNSYVVTGDQDYVVAYGILGDAVAYTVNYVDEAGNVLAESETFYGNVGDKAVIAYLYVEGYQPQAYNIGLTLGEDASKNVIDFVYTRIPQPAAPQAPAAQTAVPGPEAEGGAGEGAADEGGTNFVAPEEGGAEEVPGGAEEGNGEDGGVEIDENDVPLEEPQDYMDIDDRQTPQAGGDKPGQNNPVSGLFQGSDATVMTQRILAPVIGTLSALIIVLGILLLLRSRRKEGNE